MIWGLAWTSWLLLLCSVGLGLAINLTVYFRNRRDGNRSEQGALEIPEPGSSTDV